jgi:metallo-beta-lactamase family protein
MKLTFVGGAGEVTGACYLLEDKNERILVDCGMHQGEKSCEKRNFEPFGFDPASISALLVTHAHIDHIGRIPKLVKDGFSGSVYSTAPTKDVMREVLSDAHHLMVQELNKNQEPLYNLEHIEQALERWRAVCYRKPFSVGRFAVEFYNSGHILGSASIKITASGKVIVFSGDLGNMPAPLVKDTEYIEGADYVVIESAYGGRVHEPIEERAGVLEDMIEDTVKSSGTLLIPAFAMERTQELLYELNKLVEQGRIPKVPIFIDSPLAIHLTEVYQRYAQDPEYFDEETIAAVKRGEQIFNFPGLRFTLTVEESKEINSIPPPKVVIAGSGMSTGGRVLHHEVRYLPDPNSMIFFVGFQAKGSLGRRILDGAAAVRIMGQDVAVRARTKAVGGFSAHADQPLLLKWIKMMDHGLKKVFIVQGEADQSEALETRIKDEFAINTGIPAEGETVEL